MAPAQQGEADRPSDFNEPPTDRYEAFYFIPYTEAEQYSSNDPLYCLIGALPPHGDIMVYDRPSSAGSFHSIDPYHGTEAAELYPPTDAFNQALTKIVINEGDDVDISVFAKQMHPWEHHFLEVVITGLNEVPGEVPPEVRRFVEEVIQETTDIEVGTEDDAKPFISLTQDETERYLEQLSDRYRDFHQN